MARNIISLAKGTVAPSCSSCHQDHQGRDTSLLRVADTACTNCHRDIKRHIDGKPQSMSKPVNVTVFDQQHHPEFISAQKDPGHLKFSHYRHPDARIGQQSRRGENDLDLGPDFRSGPARQHTGVAPGKATIRPYSSIADRAINSMAAISACRMAGASPSASPPRPAGDYMLPIIYENQCQACHPLYKSPGIVQHRKTTEEIRVELRRAIAEGYLDGSPELLAQAAIPPEPLPNARPAEDEKVARRMHDKLEIAEKMLAPPHRRKVPRSGVAGSRGCGRSFRRKCHRSPTRAWLPAGGGAALGRIGQPPHRLHEVASFFPHYQLQPPPAADVKVCCDMACHLAGGETLSRFLDELGRQFPGQVCSSRASCLGRCDGRDRGFHQRSDQPE